MTNDDDAPQHAVAELGESFAQKLAPYRFHPDILRTPIELCVTNVTLLSSLSHSGPLPIFSTLTAVVRAKSNFITSKISCVKIMYHSDENNTVEISAAFIKLKS